MSLPSSQPRQPGTDLVVNYTVLPPIARWKVVIGAIAVALFTTAVVTALWWAGTKGLNGQQLVAARLDALKVGLSISIGGGGAFALYLAWRRQRSTEADLDNRERTLAHQREVASDAKALQEQVAAAAERDATARRITELYGKAVDQLGSDKAAVRLGGLYSLERLAQENPRLQQTIVSVICAYLRMPYAGLNPRSVARLRGHRRPVRPGKPLPTLRAASQTQVDLNVDQDTARQEREVRVAAQRILQAHLNPGVESHNPIDTFWPNIHLDLTGATLFDLNLSECQIHDVQFNDALFMGTARFKNATLVGNAEFENATFFGPAWFAGSMFTQIAWFKGAKFLDTAWFEGATFTKYPWFGAKFTGLANFKGSTFMGGAGFGASPAHANFGGVWAYVDVDDPKSRSWPPGWTETGSPRAREGFPGTWVQIDRAW